MQKQHRVTKYSISEIQETLNRDNRNIEVLSKEYKDLYQKLECKCLDCNYTWKTNWNTLRRGTRCPNCAGTLKYSIDEIKQILKDGNRNIEVLSKEYENNIAKMMWKCTICNHTWETRWQHIKNGTGCPKCASYKKATQFRGYSISEIQEILNRDNRNIEVLSSSYRNANDKYLWKCTICNHIWENKWHNINTLKQGCPNCAGTLKYSIDEIKQILKDGNRNIEIVSTEYTDAHSKHIWKCLSCNYVWKARWFNVRRGTGCPNCSNSSHISKPEQEITDFILQYYPNLEIVRNTRSLIPPYEIDIYIPELKIAIEFNGTYWHSDEVIKQKTKGKFKTASQYHKMKTDLCRQKSISLIHIFETEYTEFKNSILNYIVECISDKINKTEFTDKDTPENEIAEWLKHNFSEIKVKQDGTKIHIPDNKITINIVSRNTVEHSEQLLRETQQAIEREIRLIHIFEDEWENNQKEIKQVLWENITDNVQDDLPSYNIHHYPEKLTNKIVTPPQRLKNGCYDCGTAIGNLSWIEKELESFLTENQIEFEKQRLENYTLEYKTEKLSIYFYYIFQYKYEILKKNSVSDIVKLNPNSIHIFENVAYYRHKMRVIKNVILHRSGKTKRRVYARDTKVLITSPTKVIKDFINENNINGYRGCKTIFCLYHKKTKELLMTYAVGAPFGAKHQYDLEIVRGAALLGTSVVGGASKLWKAITEYYPGKSIVYYVDLNYYNGVSMGFLENVKFVKQGYGFWNHIVSTKETKNRMPSKHKEVMQQVEAGTIIPVYNAGTQTNIYQP